MSLKASKRVDWNVHKEEQPDCYPGDLLRAKPGCCVWRKLGTDEWEHVGCDMRPDWSERND